MASTDEGESSLVGGIILGDAGRLECFEEVGGVGEIWPRFGSVAGTAELRAGRVDTFPLIPLILLEVLSSAVDDFLILAILIGGVEGEQSDGGRVVSIGAGNVDATILLGMFFRGTRAPWRSWDR